jgi:hypothetical protein
MLVEIYKYCKGYKGQRRFINITRDIQMPGEIYKYHEGCTHVREYKSNGGYENVSGNL